jgi:hypothetical protein
MQNLETHVLKNYPIEVEFAGFRSNTMKLSQNGWDMSIREEYLMLDCAKLLQIAMRHTGLGIYGVSYPITIEMNEMYRHDHPVMGMNTPEILSRCLFRIVRISSQIYVESNNSVLMLERTPAFANRFYPMNAMPTMERRLESIRDFKFFNAVNPDIKDIIVDPSRVTELLDLVLKCQLPEQEILKARERTRKNLEMYRSEGSHLNMNSLRPENQIQAQILTLTG